MSYRSTSSVLPIALLVAALLGPPAAAAPAPAPAVAGASVEQGERSDIGTVDFDVSCAPAVQDDFDHALALLHHMMYSQAREAFREIAEEEPECAMAHWGVATTLFQPLWPTRPSAEDLEHGWQELQKARELGLETEREKALVRAAEAFYRNPEEGGWWPRIERWAAAMKEAHEAHPDDREVTALYALSHLAAGQTADDRRRYNAEAAKLLRSIYEEEPTHPGAIHYTIHANDIEGRAGESLDIVRSYSEIAPSVPHALHMPSHIYVRLGRWSEAMEWNRRSAEAALEHPAGDAISHHYLHGVAYLVYAHLQRGDDASARSVVEKARAKEGYQPTFISAFHLAAMPARLAVEARDWQAASGVEARTPGYIPWDRFAWPEVISRTARGLGAAHTGDLKAARAAEERIAALRDKMEEAGEKDFARYIEVDRLIVASGIARAEGRAEEAESLLRNAAEIEAEVAKHPVTPGALLPPYEALGELLLAQDRPAEALSAFERSLERWPGRYRSLLGAARAAEAAGEADEARSYARELLRNAAEGSGRSGIEEARELVEGG